MTGRILGIAMALGVALLVVRAWPGGPADRGTAVTDLVVRLGTAREVRPTGQLREFSLVVRRAVWELAPGRTVEGDILITAPFRAQPFG